MNDDGILLRVRGLSTYFFTGAGVVKAVQDVGFSIKKGRTFALVGESGCGKSTTALSIMRLVPKPQGRIVGGEIVFERRNLLAISERQMRQMRGNRIAMIFQEPMTSLNPVYTVGNQIAEAIRVHSATKTRSHEDKNKYIINFSVLVPLWQKIKLSGKEAWAGAVEMLRRVGITDPEQRVWEYPHQMSGGMRQRVMIAMAVVCKPALLIADEPTTALDVTIQAQILDLLDELHRQDGTSILLITHNLGIVAQRADDVAVMYASRIVEMGDSRRLFAEPLHPYTRGLLLASASLDARRGSRESLPRLGEWDGHLGRVSTGASTPSTTLRTSELSRMSWKPVPQRLRTIPGVVPPLGVPSGTEPLHFVARPSWPCLHGLEARATGCKFHPRCPIGSGDKRCQTFEPELKEVQPGRSVACWYAAGYDVRA